MPPGAAAGRRDRPDCAGPRLAGGTGVRRAVHEPLTTDRRPAAGAGPALLPVDLQGPVEVAALPVDVDVERVEGGAPLVQRRRHHLPRTGQHAPDLAPRQPRTEP